MRFNESQIIRLSERSHTEEYILYDTVFYKIWEDANKSTVTERWVVAWDLEGWQVDTGGSDCKGISGNFWEWWIWTGSLFWL